MGKCKVELQVRTAMGGKGKGIQGLPDHTIVEISIPNERGGGRESSNWKQEGSRTMM